MTEAKDTSDNATISLAPPPRRQLPDVSGFTEMPAKPPGSDQDSAEANAPIAEASPTEAEAEVQTTPPARDSASGKSKSAGSPKRSRKSPTKTTARSGDTSKTTAKAKKTTLHLPPDIARRLKQWKRANGRTTADGVMSAYISCRSEVAKEFEMTEEDQQRASYGLAPLAATRADQAELDDDGTRVVGVYINVRALEDLDTAATELGLSRSRYATALLRAFLPSDEA